MGSKENAFASQSANAFVKPEPQDQAPMPLAGSPTRQNSTGNISGAVRVKPEGSDGVIGAPLKRSDTLPTADALQPTKAGLERSHSNLELIKPKTYTSYASAQDIPYTPENALGEGVGMVKYLKSKVKKMEIGSKMRKDVWLREIESLQGQGAPSTMIAVCGATGAGKSSILNAILDDNIVPTSGMRACTAVVTEIAYHKEKTIAADVAFLGLKEWRDELGVLLDDLVDEDGSIKRTTNLNSDAGIAWSKVHAVYPSITQDQIGNMTVDQIIARDPRIAKILGTTKKIVAKDSKTFAHEIAKYIDSKDQKRGDKKDKKKKDEEKAKAKEGPSLMDTLRGKDKPKKDKDNSEGPAFWPLIRQVNVRCNSQALSTGAVLVDLPGVADANAARNSIAKDYMKKCNCIWILAPITRAVDDKTAKDLLGDAFKSQLMMDGNYDAHTITFIASKCDDISCSEVIGALGLDEEPELEAIEERIDECKEQTSEWKSKESEAKNMIKDIEEQMKQVRAMGKEYEAHLEALKNGEEFTPSVTGKASKKGKASAGTKRKNTHGDKKSSKRRKTGGDSDHEDEDADMDDFDDFDSFIASDNSDSESEKGEDDDGSDTSKSGSDAENDDDENEEADEPVTEESLKAKITETKEAIKAGRERLNEIRRAKKEASDMLSNLKKKQVKAQRDKNAFCSLKRSEFSRDVLKEDFRQGLKELDDAAAEQRDPDSFDPTQNLRDYAAIDLPVFTCSSRDYVRLKGQVKGDGDPTCFSNAADTGIPALQTWCQTLTVSSRERAARNFHTHLKAFAKSVRQYIECAGEVTESDRASLKEKWESGYVRNGEDGYDDEDEDDPYGLGGGGWDDSSDGGMDNDFFQTLTNGVYGNGLGGRGLLTMEDRAPKVDAYGQPVGITPRLIKEFGAIVDKCVQDLKEEFKEGLQEKCEASAELASKMATATSDEFAASMHWASYRATLRRHGSFRRDLNVELISPMTRNIAASWSKVFEADLFASFDASVNSTITKVLKEIESSAASGLKDRVKTQAEACMEEARVALKNILDVVRDTMNAEQKEVSRCIAPHVQQQLVEGYEDAMEERGTGSVARQKAVFHNFIAENKDGIFHDGADTVMERLSKAAESVGAALKGSLRDLAEKVEVSVAVLWEGVRDDAGQVSARAEVIESIEEINRQLSLWSMARDMRDAAAAQIEGPPAVPGPVPLLGQA